MPTKAGNRATGKAARKAKQPAGIKPSGAQSVDLRRLAHELRTPIGAIVSRADILRNESYGPLGDDAYRAYAQAIHDSASHALAVLVSTIDAATTTEALATTEHERANPAETDLADAIRQAVELVAALAVDAGVKLETRGLSKPCRASIDQASAIQIAANLMSNAIKFTPCGGAVKVSLKPGEGEVVLTVADKGLGIGPIELERINAAGSSLGFGYDVIHRLADLWGAHVAVESRRGQGTTARVVFSRAKAGSA